VNLKDIKLLYGFSCIALSFVILVPTLLATVTFPKGGQFPELYVLDKNHMLENLPYNIALYSTYMVYSGVGNHVGESASYLVYVKIGNETGPLPSSNDGLPSSLEPIFQYRVVLEDGEVRDREISFSFDNVSFSNSVCRVTGLSINGHYNSVERTSAFDGEKNGFFFYMFFELWAYNTSTSAFEFQNRYVGFLLNMTRSTGL
jgi:hypothetical protein